MTQKSGLALVDYHALCDIERCADEIIQQMRYLRIHSSEGIVSGEEFRLIYANTEARKIVRLADGIRKRYERNMDRQEQTRGGTQ